MRYFLAPCLLLLACALGAPASAGMLEDISAGKLINPEVGVYTWYELQDKSTQGKIYLRQAIVGAEKVKRKDGFWVETEIIPQVGFPAVYKMLLTGPANDPQNIHQVILKEGEAPPEQLPLDPNASAPPAVEEQRQSTGMDRVTTAQGVIEAEHVVIIRGADKVEVWLNDSVRPLGIVKMITPEGELVLQRFGKGGPDAESRITPQTVADQSALQPRDRVEVRVEGGVERRDTGDDAAPGAVRKNFGAGAAKDR
jgi:hypothetical protein